jgi:predicted DsbA family dithiol-disulfide isomerase
MKRFGPLILVALLAGAAVLIIIFVNNRSGPDSDAARKHEFASRFYAARPEEVSPPESPMSVGDPGAPVRIVTFIDFICPACRQLFESEKRLASRFGDKVRIDYYAFPLDRTCNRLAPRSVYPNSCVESKAFIAAAKMEMFGEVAAFHYAHYKKYFARMRQGDVLAPIQAFFGGRGRKEEYRSMLEYMRSGPVQTVLYDGIELARTLHVRAVPTIFINGRRIEGAPGYDLLEYVIAEELKKD